MTALVLIAVAFSAWPAILFLRNLPIFTTPRPPHAGASGLAVLIPARNEEQNIRGAVAAALANAGAEVLVLDDDSTDGTSKIVAEMAAREPRLRLLAGAPLPPGWLGKNWACAQLAKATTRPLLFFTDADVRLAPDAAARAGAWLGASGAQLASGVPRQQLGTFSEKLLVPLIHFVLLGFLPLGRMRRSRHPAYATGCGQLVIADAAAYRKVDGHTSIRERIHDGLALPRRFREAGFQTDLFDATDLASCRMYRTDRETWRGLAKNTHEGLGAPARIVPVTGVLLIGQVLPFALLACSRWLTTFQIVSALLAASLALLPRVLGARRFHQPMAIVALHPIGVTALVALQWSGLIRFLLRRPARWKEREYAAVVSAGDRVTPADA